jgi:DNA-binding Lrp family transcriptional regulator
VPAGPAGGACHDDVVSLDEIDRRIIGALLRNARASFAEVGEQVGLSAPAVKRRVDRLRAKRVIQGYSVVVDPAALGWTTEAFVEVYCSGRTSPEAIRRALLRHPEVVAAYTVTGEADAMAHLLTEDTRHLENALERIREEPSVQQTKSVLVLSRLIDRRPRAEPD